MLRDHPHISKVSQEFRSENDGSFVSYWVLYTPLILDALNPSYEIAKVNQLIEAVHQHCREHPELQGRVIIREVIGA